MLYFIEKVEEHGEKPLTTLTLPWEKRTRSRQRVLLDNGDEAGLVLPRGLVLRDGDLLAAENGTRIHIKAAVESVSTVCCSDPLELARLCYHLGNRHVELEINRERLCYPHDHVLDEMVRGMGYEVLIRQAPFEPETGAYGHTHGNQHE